MRRCSDGVSTVPGQIALQRMPCVTKSAATALVRPITAALLTRHKRSGSGMPLTLDATEAMLMIEPPPAAIIFGSAARIAQNCARTLRLKLKSQSARWSRKSSPGAHSPRN